MAKTKAENAQYQRGYRARNREKAADYQRKYNKKQKKKKLTSRGEKVPNLQRIAVQHDYTRSDMMSLPPEKFAQVVDRMTRRESRLAIN